MRNTKTTLGEQIYDPEPNPAELPEWRKNLERPLSEADIDALADNYEDSRYDGLGDSAYGRDE